MGRTKNLPKKKDDLFMGSCSLSTIGEFIPFNWKKTRKPSSKDKTPTYPLIIASEEQKLHYLGDVRIGPTSNILPEISNCRIKFQSVEESDFQVVILNFNESCVVIHPVEDVSFLKDFVETRIFSYNIYQQEENVYLKVYLISIPLPKFSPKFGKCIKKAFSLFYDINYDQDLTRFNSKSQHSCSNTELYELYDKLLEKRRESYHSSDVKLNCPLLKPALRPYQCEAVQWMIYRETSDELKADIHPLYQKLSLKSGLEVYYDKYSGWIEKSPPTVKGNWKGGILADEMGLGKTVEVLALILNHRFRSEGISDMGLCVKKRKKEDCEDELVIKTQLKKKDVVEDEEDVIPKKKRRTSTGPEKKASRKSATFETLETIYNRALAEFSSQQPKLRKKVSKVQCICGGTVERDLVECKVCGKWQHSTCLGWRKCLGPYKCPQCWEKSELLESRATLIVAPASLRKQWCKEMIKHLKPGLKVLNYQGNNAVPVYPTDLQDYDVVVTTYTVLQAELRLTETAQNFTNLRKQRKYWPSGSPLVRLKWWRLCLDEAQTVETPGKIVSEMAMKIPACHRWAVTGTPMSKGVKDIHGLIDYLQMEPFNEYDTWNNILFNPYLRGDKEPMYTFLSHVLWRTSKESVLDQINIPRQTHEMHVLEFSAVEKFFYNREHEVCCRDFLQIASKFDPNLLLEKMDKSDLKHLMAPLLSLRQACSDPGAVRGKGRYLSLKKNASSMKDLLDALIVKNRTDCEDSLRLMISSINGLAGIYLLRNDHKKAIKEYRKVLQLAAKFTEEEKEGKLTVDKLPLIHAMHNLAEVLAVHPSKEHTLRDSTLREDCALIEKQYIEKFMIESAAGKRACQVFTDSINQQDQDGIWYSDGFDWVTLNNLDADLIARVEMAAANANVDCDVRNESSRTLLRTTYNWNMELNDSRKELFNAINALYHENAVTKHIVIKKELVEAAMNCHLRPDKKGKKKSTKCPLCVANGKLKDYESKLFIMKQRSGTFEEMGLVGSWKPRFEEILLRSLLNVLKSKNSERDLIKEGDAQIMLFEAMKKEFKEVRRFWTLLDQQVCAQDELDICKVRLQLHTGEESKNKGNRTLKNLSYELMSYENINLIRQADLPYQELTLRSEESGHTERLEALLGTRNYLGTLKQQQFEGCTPDPCPVCRGPLVNTWAILPCAHTFCLDCFQTLIDRSTTYLNCCICRAKQCLKDIAYIKAASSDANQDSSSDSELSVIGSYSRKIEDVVRLLLELRKKDPLVKVLLFSSWSLVLKLLRKALEDNDIKSELAEATASFENRIENFKDPVKKITVLLLPIRLGAKGLNLIEATHVILLEPLLNPADELQAIGRVHRIGQTKPTVVHKFVIRNTVEESLHNATSSNAAGWEKGKITVGQLKELFKGTSIEQKESNNASEQVVSIETDGEEAEEQETGQEQAVTKMDVCSTESEVGGDVAVEDVKVEVQGIEKNLQESVEKEYASHVECIDLTEDEKQEIQEKVSGQEQAVAKMDVCSAENEVGGNEAIEGVKVEEQELEKKLPENIKKQSDDDVEYIDLTEDDKQDAEVEVMGEKKTDDSDEKKYVLIKWVITGPKVEAKSSIIVCDSSKKK